MHIKPKRFIFVLYKSKQVMKTLNTPYVLNKRNSHLNAAGNLLICGLTMLMFVSFVLVMCSAPGLLMLLNVLIAAFLLYKSNVNFNLSAKYEGYLKTYLTSNKYLEASSKFIQLGF